MQQDVPPHRIINNHFQVGGQLLTNSFQLRFSSLNCKTIIGLCQLVHHGIMKNKTDLKQYFMLQRFKKTTDSGSALAHQKSVVSARNTLPSTFHWRKKRQTRMPFQHLSLSSGLRMTTIISVRIKPTAMRKTWKLSSALLHRSQDQLSTNPPNDLVWGAQTFPSQKFHKTMKVNTPQETERKEKLCY